MASFFPKWKEKVETFLAQFLDWLRGNQFKYDMKAVWKDKVLAQSNETVVVENNHYFPSESINREFFEYSDTTSVCPWKGKAHYFHIRIGEDINMDAAWFYKEPKDAAKEIKDHVAFWKGVEVIDS